MPDISDIYDEDGEILHLTYTSFFCSRAFPGQAVRKRETKEST